MTLVDKKQNYSVEHQELIQRMIDGNSRFVQNISRNHHFSEQRERFIDGQQPYSIILTCSDSRIVPAYIFDEEIGTQFITRSAGNILDSMAIGSIEYAVKFLKSKILLIMGHKSCGAIKAAWQEIKASHHIEKGLQDFEQLFEKMDYNFEDEQDLLDKVAEENVRLQINKAYEQSDIIKEHVDNGELALIGGIYHMHRGLVTFIK
jgi:carbonic anhydrase